MRIFLFLLISHSHLCLKYIINFNLLFANLLDNQFQFNDFCLQLHQFSTDTELKDFWHKAGPIHSGQPALSLNKNHAGYFVEEARASRML